MIKEKFFVCLLKNYINIFEKDGWFKVYDLINFDKYR